MARLNTLVDELENHGPINHCIYCGANGAPLTDEHILPDGLGGTWVLLKASCRTCADLINREFESYVLRTMLGAFREKYDYRSSKSAKKKRPRPPQKLVLNKRDGSTVTVYPEKDHLPPVMFLPLMDIPGVLTGKLGSRTLPGQFMFPAEMSEYLLHHDAVSVQTPPLDYIKFARWIAKIAHAFGCAALGDAFEPVLPRIILGDTSDILDFVGGLPDETEQKPRIFYLGVGNTDDAKGNKVAVAFVRLFADTGAPLYLVVLGKLTKKWPLAESDDPALISRHIPDTNRGWVP